LIAVGVSPLHSYRATPARRDRYGARTNFSSPALAAKAANRRAQDVTRDFATNQMMAEWSVSSALIQGQPQSAGSVARVPAAKIEAVVRDAVRRHIEDDAPIDNTELVTTYVRQIEVRRTAIAISLMRRKRLRRRTGQPPSSSPGTPKECIESFPFLVCNFLSKPVFLTRSFTLYHQGRPDGDKPNRE
jgi:hypothetical protein